MRLKRLRFVFISRFFTATNTGNSLFFTDGIKYPPDATKPKDCQKNGFKSVLFN